MLKATAMLIGMFAFLQVYSIQSILPILMLDFKASEVQIGMAVGATVMAVALMSPFLGMLSDAIGRKSIIVGALVFLAIPTALIATSNNIETVTIWRFLQGISVPGITVVTIAYLGEEFKGNAIAELMAYYVSGSVLGGFLGRFILGHLHELVGWRIAYYVMAAITLAGALWVAKTLPASQNFVASPKFRTALGTLSRHLINRYVLSATLLGFCVLFSLVGCFTFINLHLAHAPYTLSTGQLANIFAVYLIGVVITPLSTKLIQRFGSARTIVVAVIISIVGVLITLSAPLWLIVIGLAIMSSGVFITQSSTIGYIASNVSEGRSLASGIYYMGYYAGGTAGAWACGLAYSYGDWTATVILLVAMQVLALIIAAFGMIKTPMHRA
ncbi:MFS transporter [Psychrobacter sp.]|uniref:MFS transporter n=1 Tax=Psychrobacter sp. TaxID=56811 RepID=UPI0025F156B2|nr:MFS transporter [Psychrobacter sp.]